ncbi:A24 family peptidase [Sphingomonas desiccabilis]|uniref:Peptidase n=1 Tax=Sphingomonas desiccabilis TaxID=429134 RepID=A0A4V1QP27_9SPHN|nr:prepilin peptidase [Sphingomonas desiccabilis]MBB3911542.1 prepilin peptidase CpaA [Sphingomonas desiccabilis]RXZ31704.1 peptidase [Sphingomonas desiccabilis]
MPLSLPSILLLALVALLLSAGIEDVRTREIANWKNGLIALLAPGWWMASGLSPWPGVAIQLAVAVAVFGLFVAAFWLGQMGGGDVKLIGALALWLPPQPLLWMLILMSLLGGALTLLMVLDKLLRKKKQLPEIPYGVAIAMAALLVIREPILNQFR